MKNFWIVILFFFTGLTARAQDPHLSLYDSAPLFLNSSMTGVFQGDWRLHAQYRTQWKAVNFKPYQSALISFDRSVGKWGWGLQLNNFRAGEGNFNVLQGLASLSYTVPLDRRKHHNLSFGVQGGLIQKSLEYQLLTFNNQYTLSGGGAFDNQLPNNETLNDQSMLLPSANAGILYYFGKQQAKVNPFLGFSAFNLTQPRESFYGQENRLPLRYYAHAGMRINFTEYFYILPKVLAMQQSTATEMTVALEAGYYLQGSEAHLLLGAIARSKDSGIITLGIKKEKIIVRMGYDINLSTLSSVSKGRGGFEIAVTYIQMKNKPITSKICPRI